MITVTLAKQAAVLRLNLRTYTVLEIESSLFEDHVLDNKHQCELTNLEILHDANRGFKITWLCAFEIRNLIFKYGSPMNTQLHVMNYKTIEDVVAVLR